MKLVTLLNVGLSGLLGKEFGPLNYFKAYFGPFMKKVGNPCHRCTKGVG